MSERIYNRYVLSFFSLSSRSKRFRFGFPYLIHASGTQLSAVATILYMRDRVQYILSPATILGTYD
ncbi:hypothetical protein RSAG8_11718, partial [Rhizoctonia solani AG-8 WAC10335]